MAASFSLKPSSSSSKQIAASTTPTALMNPMGHDTLRCCLVDRGQMCLQTATAEIFNKALQRVVNAHKLKIYVDSNASHTYICDHHRRVIEAHRDSSGPSHRSSGSSGSGKRSASRKDEEDSPPTKQAAKLNLNRLTADSIKRCKKFFKIASNRTTAKNQIAELQKHVESMPVDEKTQKETIAYFIFAVKTDRNRLEHNHKSRSKNANHHHIENDD